LVVFLARCEGVWLGLALCEAAEVDALVGTDDGTLVVSELVGDPTLQETRISSIGSTHGVFTQSSIHRDLCASTRPLDVLGSPMGTAERCTRV